MSPEELHDEMITKATFDDAYIDATVEAFSAWSPEDLLRFMKRLSESQGSYTAEQRTTLQKINLALAQKPKFNEALKRFNDWRAVQPVPPPPPSVHNKPATPDSPDGDK